MDKMLKMERNSDSSLLELSHICSCHEHGVTTLESALKFPLQIETAHYASRVFSSPNTQGISQAPAATTVFLSTSTLHGL